MFDVQVQQVRVQLWETVEIPQLQLFEFWTGCCMPVVCNDRCRMVDDMAQFIDGCGRPCDHAATLSCDSGSAPDSVHRQSQRTFQLATDAGTRL